MQTMEVSDIYKAGAGISPNMQDITDKLEKPTPCTTTAVPPAVTPSSTSTPEMMTGWTNSTYESSSDVVSSSPFMLRITLTTPIRPTGDSHSADSGVTILAGVVVIPSPNEQ